MKISTEKLANRQLKLMIELEPRDVSKTLQETQASLSRRVSVPGFRKGKVPPAIMENYLGKEAVLSEALKKLIPEAYERAVKEQGIETVAQPEVEVLSREPLTFNAIVSLAPEVEPGDYPRIKFDASPEVTSEEVDKALAELREKQAVWSPVDRPVDFGDMLIVDAWGEVDGKPFFDYKDATYRVIKEHAIPLPGFGERLVGMKKGEKRKFTVSFPAEHSDAALAGKNYLFRVEVKEVKEARLPEVDDGFARSLGSENPTSLREKVANELKTQAEKGARAKWEADVIEALRESSKVEYPPVMVEREMNRVLASQAAGFRDRLKGLETYLNSLGKTLDDYREELRPAATRVVERSLLLDKVAEKEDMAVTDAEIEAEIEQVRRGNPGGKEFWKSDSARAALRQTLLQRKAMEKLLQIAQGGERNGN